MEFRQFLSISLTFFGKRMSNLTTNKEYFFKVKNETIGKKCNILEAKMRQWGKNVIPREYGNQKAGNCIFVHQAKKI